MTVLREGYDLRKFQADALSGLTVAIVALPLSMAIAIASGVTPDRVRPDILDPASCAPGGSIGRYRLSGRTRRVASTSSVFISSA